jgi:hypothetical protein
MKRLSRIPGYTITQTQRQRFNEMYSILLIDQIESDENIHATKLNFSENELKEFYEYYELAMADEEKRWEAMCEKKLNLYTTEEIAWFNHMQDILTTYNELLQNGVDPIILPDFSEIETMELCRYRQLVISKQYSDFIKEQQKY